MSDFDAFRNAIKARPWDEALRLAFADWLDENDRGVEARECRQGAAFFADDMVWQMPEVRELADHRLCIFQGRLAAAMKSVGVFPSARWANWAKIPSEEQGSYLTIANMWVCYSLGRLGQDVGREKLCRYNETLGLSVYDEWAFHVVSMRDLSA